MYSISGHDKYTKLARAAINDDTPINTAHNKE
jgi:hypothetical protein